MEARLSQFMSKWHGFVGAFPMAGINGPVELAFACEKDGEEFCRLLLPLMSNVSTVGPSYELRDGREFAKVRLFGIDAVWPKDGRR